jgi:hypothetical protein
MVDSTRQAGVEDQTQLRQGELDFQALFEITPSMIIAGVQELEEKQFGQQLSEIVQDIFVAMLVESPLNPNL